MTRTHGLRWMLAAVFAAIVAIPLGAQAAEPWCPKAPADAIAPSPAAIPGAQTYVYKAIDGQPLRLYVFQPTGGQPDVARHPAIVLFAGGGWMYQNAAFLSPQARYFASRGAVTVLVDYRVYCRDGVNIVDEARDARAAMSWVRAHAGELGVVPSKIAALGGSAGGHVALSTAMFNELNEPGAASPRPDLLLLFFPCVDETTEVELKYSAKAIQTYGPAMSPALHITGGLPPMLVIQGTADVLHDENKAYCANVAKAGNRCRFSEYKDAPHGFFRPGTKWYDAARRETDQFLVEHGYLPPA